MSETKLTDPSEQNSKEKSKSEEFSRIVIADYLENYDKTTRNGSCKACGHLVVWARDRIRSHKKSNCPNATESEKKMFANKSTNKKVKPKNEVRPFKIAECLKDFDKITSRGKCKDCGKKVQWSRAASIAHKVTCEKSTEELEKICGLKKNREVKTTPKRPDKTSIVMPSAILDAPDDSSEAHPDFYDIVSPKKKIEDQPMTQQSRANNDCFICKTSFEGSRKRLTNNLDFSETPVFEVLESFTGADITKDELKTSGICINCFSELNKFDEFQHLSKMIQLKITDAFQRTRSEQIFVKSEMIFEDEEHVDDHPTIDQEAEPDFLAEDSEKILDETRQSDLEDDEINFSPIADVTLECDKCSKRCKSQNQMEFHMVAEHSLDNQNGPFECHKCAKTLMTKTGLLKHGSIHEPDRNFLCTECGATLASRDSFKLHLMIHDDIRPFACEYNGCTKTFRMKQKLKLHLTTHTGEKNFQCSHCPDKRFAHSSGLSWHIRSYHKNKPKSKNEACNVCGVTFPTRTKLNLHLVKRHNVEM